MARNIRLNAGPDHVTFVNYSEGVPAILFRDSVGHLTKEGLNWLAKKLAVDIEGIHARRNGSIPEK